MFEVGQGNALIELLCFPQRSNACARHFHVLIFGPGAHADRANAFAIYFQGNPAANRCLMSPASNGQAEGEQHVHFLAASGWTRRLPPDRGRMGLVERDIDRRNDARLLTPLLLMALVIAAGVLFYALTGHALAAV